MVIFSPIGKLLSSSGKLLQLRTSKKDAGFYTCKADNGIGTIEQRIYLNINGIIF